MTDSTLEQIRDELSEIKQILARQEESLKLHIYRTELAEENIGMLRDEIRPIKRHVDVVNTVSKILVVLIPLVVTIYKLLGK